MTTSMNLQQVLAAQGAVFDDVSPSSAMHFGNAREERLALQHQVGMVDRTQRTQIEIFGEDRLRFLQSLTTNDLRPLKPGQGTELFFLNVKGRVIAYVTAFCEEDSMILETSAGQAETILGHLDHYLIRDRVTWEDRTETWAELLLSGSQTTSFLSSIGIEAIPAELHAHTKVEIASIPCSLRRVDWTAETAYVLCCLRDQVTDCWNALLEAKARPCGETAYQVARIERGTPSFRFEFNEKTLPQELNRIERTICFTKGCYLGQETVAKLDALGQVNRLLVGFEFELNPAAESQDTVQFPEPGMTLVADGRKSGMITSAAFSELRGRYVALGYARRGKHEPGTVFESSSGPVKVVPLPMTEDS
ncbi:Folate-binding protein YgfZ [Planctomycetales bacterium 10988]|nr:Folate-binding protein YgfZ [Planctomycetales bacterium 10988]